MQLLPFSSETSAMSPTSHRVFAGFGELDARETLRFPPGPRARSLRNDSPFSFSFFVTPLPPSSAFTLLVFMNVTSSPLSLHPRLGWGSSLDLWTFGDLSLSPEDSRSLYKNNPQIQQMSSKCPQTGPASCRKTLFLLSNTSNICFVRPFHGSNIHVRGADKGLGRCVCSVFRGQYFRSGHNNPAPEGGGSDVYTCGNHIKPRGWVEDNGTARR